jgi:dTDP-glucose 4,6-dehydratase
LIDGRIGESYNIGEDIETSNIDLVIKIVELFAEISPELRLFERENIKYVQDRPGHDRRYSLDSSKIRKELGWIPKTSLSDGLRRTIKWYMKKEIGRT